MEEVDPEDSLAEVKPFRSKREPDDAEDSTRIFTDRAENIKIVPEYFQGLFFQVWVFIFIVTGIITAFWGELDWNDNIIYNSIGANNICVIFDYKPAIFITPFLSCFLANAGTWYMLSYWKRIHLIFDESRFSTSDDPEILKKKMSTREFVLFTISTVLEVLSYFLFNTVFFVNEENPTLHILAYAQAIIIQMISGWRNVYYLWTYGTLSERKKWVLIYFGLVFTYFGTHYVMGIISWVFFDYVLLIGSSDFQLAWVGLLDIGFTFMYFFGHALAYKYVAEAGNSLYITVALKDGNENRSYYDPSWKGFRQISNYQTFQKFSDDFADNPPADYNRQLTQDFMSTPGVHENHTQVYQMLPEYFQGYFYALFFFLLVITSIVTASASNIDYSDNMIHNTIGFNAVLVFFNYSPAIYITPFISGIMVVCSTFYIFGYWMRIKMLLALKKITMFKAKLYAFSILIEVLSLYFFMSVFGINDEDELYHITAYTQFIFFQIILGWRNIKYLWDFGHIDDTKKRYLFIWAGLFTFLGIVYVNALLVQAYGDVRGREGYYVYMHIVEKLFIIIFVLGHTFIGVFLGDRGKSLVIGFAFKEGQDSTYEHWWDWWFSFDARGSGIKAYERGRARPLSLSETQRKKRAMSKSKNASISGESNADEMKLAGME